MSEMPTIKELIQDNFVVFDYFRDNTFFYIIQCKITAQDYVFPVPLSDVTGGETTPTLPAREKAIFFMRWIRKAREAGTLISLGAKS